MKTTAAAFLLTSSLHGGQGVRQARAPPNAEKSTALASKLEAMRHDYPKLQAKCWGEGDYVLDPPGGRGLAGRGSSRPQGLQEG